MSRHIRVTRTIPAPVAEVFAMFADSDRLSMLPGVRVTVLEPGREFRDGVGLRRRLDLGGGVFLVEEVVGLEPPRLFSYRIRESRPAFRHEQGDISFTERGSGTLVDWTSTLSTPAGPFTPLVEVGASLLARTGFSVVLTRIARTLSLRGK
ncbi:SRPBCC family protein [Nocardioides pocheonensis]|jgi:uncharacterized protein YndB with AHSA1/START domain|uniref:SRPBCC family protein n=1 Tax=Nocardioides pocheonensis TaxID=661485 RepID=A0A3N0GI17_9ACTN|nr:SRPBCC family protein [Nocardioides pocheonensis]RNM11782.1 SRPBCC family protein [Nocardioides pocheonensis]